VYNLTTLLNFGTRMMLICMRKNADANGFIFVNLSCWELVPTSRETKHLIRLAHFGTRMILICLRKTLIATDFFYLKQMYNNSNNASSRFPLYCVPLQSGLEYTFCISIALSAFCVLPTAFWTSPDCSEKPAKEKQANFVVKKGRPKKPFFYLQNACFYCGLVTKSWIGY